jgi:hypothetical protein
MFNIFDLSNNARPLRGWAAPILFLAGLCLAEHLLAQEATPPAYLQIVNATSVPAISLNINGKETYPLLNQGDWIGSAPRQELNIRYKATDLASGAKGEPESIRFKALEHQTLVILGDFSTDVPAGTLRQPDVAKSSTGETYPPNVIFRVYSHNMGPQDKMLRFRFVNGMPGLALKLSGASTKTETILPGNEVVLNGQPKPAIYVAEAKGRKMDITLVQKENINQTVVFYLKDGEPVFCAFNEDR